MHPPSTALQYIRLCRQNYPESTREQLLARLMTLEGDLLLMPKSAETEKYLATRLATLKKRMGIADDATIS